MFPVLEVVNILGVLSLSGVSRIILNVFSVPRIWRSQWLECSHYFWFSPWSHSSKCSVFRMFWIFLMFPSVPNGPCSQKECLDCYQHSECSHNSIPSVPAFLNVPSISNVSNFTHSCKNYQSFWMFPVFTFRNVGILVRLRKLEVLGKWGMLVTFTTVRTIRI